MQKVSIPKGTRDFLPSDMVKREYIFSTIRKAFKKYGYSPIETPAMENLTTLLGKYGEEGDKLLFKILNSGDFLAKADTSAVSENDASRFAREITEKGLRYDLTVPFARFIVQHRNDIKLPFKRYQIQPVWRADRPQKGRYREFYQCDADVVGSNSLLNELELLQLVQEVFNALSIRVTVKVNNRKILAGIADTIGAPEMLGEITTAMDKIEKTGVDKVMDELTTAGLSQSALDKLRPFLEMKGEYVALLDDLHKRLINSETGRKGVDELMMLFNLVKDAGLDIPVELDLTLARGLNYYTGAIIEVKANDVEIGSICGGGRYDDLTGIFGWKDVSGVGISFGADRIYDVLNQLNAYPEEVSVSTKVLILNLGEKEQIGSLSALKKLREKGIASEYYPDVVDKAKQYKYAEAKDIPFVLFSGEEEINKNVFTLKSVQTGNQESLTIKEIIDKLL
jgi:histidyl-tRNA synthetase